MLKEIVERNQDFPVEKLYRCLCSKSKLCLISIVCDILKKLFSLQCFSVKGDNSGNVTLTNILKPTKACQMLGNRQIVKKIKSWLIDWRNKTDLELKKLRRDNEKNSKKFNKKRDPLKRGKKFSFLKFMNVCKNFSFYS